MFVCGKSNWDLCLSGWTETSSFPPLISFCPGGAGERAPGGGIKYPDVSRKAAEHRNMKSAGLPSLSAPHPL